MRKRLNDSKDAIFITIDEACRLTSLGRNTVRKLAKESNSVRKIGKLFRIERNSLISYIQSFED